MKTPSEVPTPEEIKKLLEAKEQGKAAFVAVLKQIWNNRGVETK